jgi:hypothetical protein
VGEKLQEGLSAQYGVPSSARSNQSVWYNFLAYPDGEVHVRGNDGNVILGDDGFLTLAGLYSKAADKVVVLLPEYTRNDNTVSGAVFVLDRRAIESMDLYLNAAISLTDGRVLQFKET